MATNKNVPAEETVITEEVVPTKKDDRVAVFIPRGAANDEPNVLIGVNGVNYVLPKGKTSMVPPHIKAEYDRSVAAQEKMDERVDALLKEANTPLPGATV